MVSIVHQVKPMYTNLDFNSELWIPEVLGTYNFDSIINFLSKTEIYAHYLLPNYTPNLLQI